jgi:hypothetical protein
MIATRLPNGHPILGSQLEPCDVCCAAYGLDQRAQSSQGCGLSGAIRSQEAKDLAASDVEREVLVSDPVAKPLGERPNRECTCGLIVEGGRNPGR